MDFDDIKARWVEGYVDIHGRSLRTVEDVKGNIFIPIEEIRKTGFRIFEKETFDSFLIRKESLNAEFKLHLLGAAKEYLLRNYIANITSNDILEAIESCKNVLLNGSDTSKPLPKATNITITRKFDETNCERVIRMPNNHTGTLRDTNKVQQRQNNFNNCEERVDQCHSKNGLTDNHNITSDFNQIDNNTCLKDDTNSISSDSEKCVYKNVNRDYLSDTNQKLKVTVTQSFFNIFFGYPIESEEKLKSIEKKCQIGDSEPDVKYPSSGNKYLVHHNGSWMRCLLIKSKNSNNYVHLLDSGKNIYKPQLRQIPAHLENFPTPVLRFSIPKISKKTIEVGQTYEGHIKMKYDDGTYLFDPIDNAPSSENFNCAPKSQNRASTKALTPVFMNSIKYSTNLNTGDVVLILGEENGKFYLRTKEIHGIYSKNKKEIETTNPEPIEDLKINQLVLCYKENCPELCRGIVEEINNDYVKVNFIDFYKIERRPLKNIFYANTRISSMDVPIIESPCLKGYNVSNQVENAKDLLDSFILQKTKFVVHFENNEFDLLLKDKSLSNMLYIKSQEMPTKEEFKLTKQKLETSQVCNSISAHLKDTLDHTQKPSITNEGDKTDFKIDKPKEIKRVLFDEMKELDSKLVFEETKFMITTFNTYQDITIIRNADMEILNELTDIDVSDTEPYTPEIFEVCLGQFEGAWYRCTITEDNQNQSYDVLFIEYGNIATLTTDSLRPLPDKLKDLPMLGITCSYNLPENQKGNSEKISDMIKDLVNTTVVVKVLSYENEIYSIEIPEIKKSIK